MYSFFNQDTLIGRLCKSRIICAIIVTVFVLSTSCTFSAGTMQTAGVVYAAEIDSTLSGTQNGNAFNNPASALYNVTVIRADQSVTLHVNGITATQAVELAQFETTEDDIWSLSPETVIQNDCVITILVVTFENRIEQEAIAFETETVNSSAYAKGVQKVTREGKDGVKKVEYTDKFVDGELTESLVTGESILTAPVSKQITLGTAVAAGKRTTVNTAFKSASSSPVTTDSAINEKIVSPLAPEDPIELDENGRPVNYKQLITGRATAYSPEDGNYTAIGAPAQVGYVAVNPNQIPYGTRLYIVTPNGSYVYGYAMAADTGGFVKKGNITVDLFFATAAECIQFGVRNVEIYVI